MAAFRLNGNSLVPGEQGVSYANSGGTLKNQKQLFGYVASAALALGTFLPAVSMPIVGSITYFNNGKGDGMFVLIAAVVAVVLVAVNKFKFLLIPALAAFAITAYDLVNFMIKIDEMKSSMEGNIFAGLADTVQLQFGWFVIILAEAALVLIALGVLPRTKPQAE